MKKTVRIDPKCPSPEIPHKCCTCGHRNIKAKRIKPREMIPCKFCEKDICSHCFCSDGICLDCSERLLKGTLYKECEELVQITSEMEIQEGDKLQVISKCEISIGAIYHCETVIED